MKVRFLYSKVDEEERLMDLYSEYQWFLDNHFPIVVPRFYHKLFSESKNKEIFKKELHKRFYVIYNRNIYNKKRVLIQKDWNHIEKTFFKSVQEMGFTIKPQYICQLSLYGPQGQFWYPCTINLRVCKSIDIKEATESIAHELIHLFIFNKVKKLKLSYKQIEGVVDLFFTETELKNIFPKYKLQSIAIHNKALFHKILS